MWKGTWLAYLLASLLSALQESYFNSPADHPLMPSWKRLKENPFPKGQGGAHGSSHGLNVALA